MVRNVKRFFLWPITNVAIMRPCEEMRYFKYIVFIVTITRKHFEMFFFPAKLFATDTQTEPWLSKCFILWFNILCSMNEPVSNKLVYKILASCSVATIPARWTWSFTVSIQKPCITKNTSSLIKNQLSVHNSSWIWQNTAHKTCKILTKSRYISRAIVLTGFTRFVWSRMQKKFE